MKINIPFSCVPYLQINYFKHTSFSNFNEFIILYKTISNGTQRNLIKHIFNRILAVNPQNLVS